MRFLAKKTSMTNALKTDLCVENFRVLYLNKSKCIIINNTFTNIKKVKKTEEHIR